MPLLLVLDVDGSGFKVTTTTSMQIPGSELLSLGRCPPTVENWSDEFAVRGFELADPPSKNGAWSTAAKG